MNVTILTALGGKFKKAYLPKQAPQMAIQIASMKELGVEFETSEVPLYERAKPQKKEAKKLKTEKA